MNEIIRPGAGLLFMKVGIHAQEPLKDIIARKKKEIADAGVAMWGYGGNTCNPLTMVQPFAKSFERRGQAIHLVMHEMESHHFAEQIRADEYSVDGVTWQRVHPSINVRGSRYALFIKDLREEKMVLPLDQTKVAIGNCQGRTGSRYIQGRVDKACFEVAPEAERSNEPGDKKDYDINLVAEVIAPYAVYLRNTTG